MFNLKSFFNAYRYRIYSAFAAISLIIQFYIFKYFYPFPSFISGDSYFYIRAAANNATVDFHPIGYSKFLRLFSVFSTSDLILTGFQYLLLQASTLAFIFTLIYFYKPGRVVEMVLVIAIVINPVSLYLANLVASDCLFTALSFIWLSLLLWTLNKPAPRLIIWHGLILFLAFTMRYNALYYPFISTLVYLLSPQRPWLKLVGVGASFVLIIWFVFSTIDQNQGILGQRIFSPFSGWQLASNALYAYRHTDSIDRKPVPGQFKQLDDIVRNYFDTSHNLKINPPEQFEEGTVYLWDSKSPLQQYSFKTGVPVKITKDPLVAKYYKWAMTGRTLGQYGSWLVHHYPRSYIEYFLWPNVKNFYSPSPEFLGEYNMGIDSILPIAQQWFATKNKKVGTRFSDGKASIIEYYPNLLAMINIYTLFCFLTFCFIRNRPKNYRTLISLTACIWLSNFCFSVIASPVMLRYQIFFMIVFFAITLLLSEFLYKALEEKN